jgi:polygalacturonase
MKKLSILFLLGITYLGSLGQKSLDSYIATAPFSMSKPSLPAFPNKVFRITDFGALPDGKTLNTDAFRKAIEACSAAGGGIVEIPSGVWLTGPIQLKSNVNLHTHKGTLVQFSDDHTLYNIFKPSGSNSFRVMSPIYGENLENIAITGEGVFDGAGESWRPVKKSKVSASLWTKFTQTGVVSTDGKVWWPNADAMNGESYVSELKKNPNATADDYIKARDFLRPYMFMLSKCNKVLIDSVGLKNSPNFIFYPTRCTNLSITNAIIYNEAWAQNGDGIDISACKNVVIYNTMVNAGDDGICMKSSGGKDSTQAELKNILIAGCTVLKAHGGFVIGSNTDGGMQNIYVTDCVFNGTDIGIRVKSNRGRGGNVKDIYINNIRMDNIVKEAILFTTFYEDKPAGKSSKENTDEPNDKIPHYNNFHITNVLCTGSGTAISITGLPEQPAHDLYFENIDIKAQLGLEVTDARDIYLKNVKINDKEPTCKCIRSVNVNADGKNLE